MRRFAKTRPPFTFQNPHRRLKNLLGESNIGPGDQLSDETDERPWGDIDENQESEAGDASNESDEADATVPDDASETSAELTDTTLEEFELDEPPAHLARLPGLIQNDSNAVIREFHSFSEFVETAARDDLYAWKWVKLSHALGNGGGHMGSGTNSFDEALKLARFGWPEGRKLMSESLALIIPRPEPFRSQIYDVGGAYPIVPIAITGDPACMVDFYNANIATQPIVRIDQNIRASWNVEPETMMTHGAAVLSLVSDLEARGYSVELRIFEHNHCIARGPNLIWSAIYKRAGELLDLDRAAFALAHPAVLRRFGFTMREQSPELERGYSAEYGFETNKPIDLNVITIPPVSKGETPERAREIVQKAAADFLTNSNLENAA
jgi:hypothetical protein